MSDLGLPRMSVPRIPDSGGPRCYRIMPAEVGAPSPHRVLTRAFHRYDRGVTSRFALSLLVSFLGHAIVLVSLAFSPFVSLREESPRIYSVLEARISCQPAREKMPAFLETRRNMLSSNERIVIDEVVLPTPEFQFDVNFIENEYSTTSFFEPVLPLHVPENLTLLFREPAVNYTPDMSTLREEHGRTVEVALESGSEAVAPLSVSGDDESDSVARVLEGVNRPPAYPLAARRRGYEGLVVVLVRISPDGRCLHASVVRSSGYEILDRAAVNALREWLFEPALQDGKPVESWLEIPVRFRLK